LKTGENSVRCTAEDEITILGFLEPIRHEIMRNEEIVDDLKTHIIEKYVGAVTRGANSIRYIAHQKITQGWITRPVAAGSHLPYLSPKTTQKTQ
jgi:hypothetical protein